MSIAAFIRDTILRPRLLEAGCMVVYDPDRRYQAICASLEDERVRVPVQRAVQERVDKP